MSTFNEYFGEAKKKINTQEIIAFAKTRLHDIDALNIGDALDDIISQIAGGYSDAQLEEIEQILKNNHKKWWR